MNHDPHEAIEFIYKWSSIYAQAKATRVYLEEFRKSKKSLLMQASCEETIGAQEREAYAHHEYQVLLSELRKAVETEESLRWKLIAAQTRIEIWRTESVNNRNIERAIL